MTLANLQVTLAHHLQALASHPLWEVRLGGLLGLKCLLAASASASALLPAAFPVLLQGVLVRLSHAAASSIMLAA